MPKTIEDINKNSSKVCENCIYQQHCPYQDKSACIEVRSFNNNNHDTESNSEYLQETNYQDLQ